MAWTLSTYTNKTQQLFNYSTSFPGQPGNRYYKSRTILDFNDARDDGVAVTSTEPYANRLFQTDNQHLISHHATFPGRMLFLTPYQSSEGTSRQSTVPSTYKFICWSKFTQFIYLPFSLSWRMFLIIRRSSLQVILVFGSSEPASDFIMRV